MITPLSARSAGASGTRSRRLIGGWPRPGRGPSEWRSASGTSSSIRSPVAGACLRRLRPLVPGHRVSLSDPRADLHPPGCLRRSQQGDFRGSRRGRVGAPTAPHRAPYRTVSLPSDGCDTGPLDVLTIAGRSAGFLRSGRPRRPRRISLSLGPRSTAPARLPIRRAQPNGCPATGDRRRESSPPQRKWEGLCRRRRASPSHGHVVRLVHRGAERRGAEAGHRDVGDDGVIHRDHPVRSCDRPTHGTLGA